MHSWLIKIKILEWVSKYQQYLSLTLLWVVPPDHLSPNI
jgi:hypothetical protein